MRDSTGVTYLLGDNLGSMTMAVNPSGQMTAQSRYYAFGDARPVSGNLPTTYRFTGQRLDQLDSGVALYYYGARYYDPYLSQWTQPDSIIPQPGNPQSLNRYSYANNNPLRYTDPTGHDGQDVSDFLWGLSSQWAYDNNFWSLSAKESLKVQSGESDAKLAGRLVGNTIAGLQGLAQATIGGTAALGGGIFCLTGIGCVAGGGEVALVGAVVAADGAIVAGTAAGQSLVLAAATGAGTSASRNLNLSDKIKNQMGKRGWTKQGIDDVIRDPALTRKNPKILNRANGNSVTYYYRPDGYYVVVDDVTGEVVQIANINDKGWIDEMTNLPVAPVQ